MTLLGTGAYRFGRAPHRVLDQPSESTLPTLIDRGVVVRKRLVAVVDLRSHADIRDDMLHLMLTRRVSIVLTRPRDVPVISFWRLLYPCLPQDRAAIAHPALVQRALTAHDLLDLHIWLDPQDVRHLESHVVCRAGRPRGGDALLTPYVVRVRVVSEDVEVQHVSAPLRRILLRRIPRL